MAKLEPLTSIPVLAAELIDQLDATFPERCPSMSDPDRKVWFDAGRRSVVTFLLDLVARSESRG